MTDKELRRLSRMELVQLLLDVTKENETLQAENAELKQQLEDRKLAMDRVGNIAEASLVLNKVFEDAQKAADLYKENVKRVYTERATQQAKKVQKRLAEMEQETRQRCRQMEERAAEAYAQRGQAVRRPADASRRRT